MAGLPLVVVSARFFFFLFFFKQQPVSTGTSSQFIFHFVLISYFRLEWWLFNLNAILLIYSPGKPKTTSLKSPKNKSTQNPVFQLTFDLLLLFNNHGYYGMVACQWVMQKATGPQEGLYGSKNACWSKVCLHKPYSSLNYRPLSLDDPPETSECESSDLEGHGSAIE